MNPLRRARKTAFFGQRNQMRQATRIDLMHDLKRNPN